MANILYKAKRSVTDLLVEPEFIDWSFYQKNGFNSGFPISIPTFSTPILNLVEDFTLEVIVRFTSFSVSTKIQTNGILSADPGDGFPVNGWALFHRYTSTTKTLVFHHGDTDYLFDFECSTNQNYHLAVVRVGTELTTWVDGVLTNTHIGVPTTFNASGNTLFLGCVSLYFDRERDLSGLIYGVRLLNEPVYQSTFTPPSFL